MKDNERIDWGIPAHRAKTVLESLAVKKDSQEPGHITEVTYSKGGEPMPKHIPSAEEVFFTDLANRISALEAEVKTLKEKGLLMDWGLMRIEERVKEIELNDK